MTRLAQFIPCLDPPGQLELRDGSRARPKIIAVEQTGDLQTISGALRVQGKTVSDLSLRLTWGEQRTLRSRSTAPPVEQFPRPDEQHDRQGINA